MSQCLTFPPLMIPRKHASGHQNLVDSTKLKRILIDSKKAKPIEKKETKKHKKELKGEKSRKHSSKKVFNESEQLEKSDLTEELNEPKNNLGYLSDGSQNSNKRKRDESPSAIDSLVKVVPVVGKPLKLRLILKPKTQVAPVQEKSISHQDSVSCSKPTEPEVNRPSTSVAATAEAEKIKKHKPNKEDRYNALFGDWTLPSIYSSSIDDDDDWLVGNKTQQPKASTNKFDEVMTDTRHGDSSCWPRAQFLPKVGIYTLPYTVPF